MESQVLSSRLSVLASSIILVTLTTMPICMAIRPLHRSEYARRIDDSIQWIFYISRR